LIHTVIFQDEVMHRVKADIENIKVKSFDGTLINTFKCGKGPHKWLLTPGLGTPVYSWRYLFEYFNEKMTIVTWEPRGLYGSEAPNDISRLTVYDHMRDGLEIMRQVGWENEKFVTGGWSMGIEIGLEIYNNKPSRIVGLALLNGAFEHVLKTAFDFPGMYPILKGLLKTATAASPLVNPLSRYILSRHWTVRVLENLKLVTANREFFAEVLQEFSTQNFAVYFPLMLELNKHSAREILPRVQVPTLITAGTMDRMTPVSSAEFMRDSIKDAELFIIPNGTHYTTIEYPEIINLRLEHFFRNRVFADSWR